jgi:hypothetical protein
VRIRGQSAAPPGAPRMRAYLRGRPLVTQRTQTLRTRRARRHKSEAGPGCASLPPRLPAVNEDSARSTPTIERAMRTARPGSRSRRPGLRDRCQRCSPQEKRPTTSRHRRRTKQSTVAIWPMHNLCTARMPPLQPRARNGSWLLRSDHPAAVAGRDRFRGPGEHVVLFALARRWREDNRHCGSPTTSRGSPARTWRLSCTMRDWIAKSSSRATGRARVFVSGSQPLSGATALRDTLAPKQSSGRATAGVWLCTKPLVSDSAIGSAIAQESVYLLLGHKRDARGERVQTCLRDRAGLQGHAPAWPPLSACGSRARGCRHGNRGSASRDE